MNELTRQPRPTPGDVYLHLKTSTQYVVVYLAKDEATKADVVVYRSLKTGEVWVRPLAEFVYPRFNFID